MVLKIFDDVQKMGKVAALQAAGIVNKSIAENGYARIVLSTGASQFAFFESFVKQNIPWDKVEMFHLDEYVGAAETHKASFCKYLKERFLNKVPVKKVHLISGEGDVEETIRKISEEINVRPIALGMIGVGENGHIAFSDPPADFQDARAYKIVELDERCKKQQVSEGWFPDVSSVFSRAISMTCLQIMKCENIISFVPYKAKAQAIKNMFEKDHDPFVPATLLKEHKNFTLYCDKESSSLLKGENL